MKELLQFDRVRVYVSHSEVPLVRINNEVVGLEASLVFGQRARVGLSTDSSTAEVIHKRLRAVFGHLTWLIRLKH